MQKPREKRHNNFCARTTRWNYSVYNLTYDGIGPVHRLLLQLGSIALASDP